MEALVMRLMAEPYATAAGAFGITCLIAWPLMRTRRAMLLGQLGVGLGFGLQYAALGAWTGASTAAIGVTHTVLALAIGVRGQPSAACLAFAPTLAALAAAVTWSGPVSLLAASALAFVLLARMQATPLRIRGFALAGSPFGIAYDLMVFAPAALAAAIASAAINATMLLRAWRERQAD